MKGDFTRFSYDPLRHFSRVLQQQGRVTLDADSNEQTAILLHYLRTLTQDLLGSHARPSGQFEVNLTGRSLMINPGRYYVDGILCENEEICDYSKQWDFIPDADDPFLKALGANDWSGTFGLYLDVWERHVSYIEDDYIREKALGGPDTCTRAKVVWQVKAISLQEGATDCDSITGPLIDVASPLLNARLDPGAAPKDPCTLSPDARYRGAENQLYRVEVHRSGAAGEATFKWSRDNGSVVTNWLQTVGNDLVVRSARGFAAGNWVELLDDAAELQGRPGVLVLLTQVEGNRLTIDPTTVPGGASTQPSAQARHPRVRRWDQVANDATELEDDNAIKIVESTLAAPNWLVLEDGVQIQFMTTGATYHTGDYWMIPARVATGDIEWPPGGTAADGAGTDTSRPPRGIRHHYAPLAVVALSNDNESTVTMCPCIFDGIADCSEKARVTTKNQPAPVGVAVRPAAAPLPVPAVAQPKAVRRPRRPAGG